MSNVDHREEAERLLVKLAEFPPDEADWAQATATAALAHAVLADTAQPLTLVQTVDGLTMRPTE